MGVGGRLMKKKILRLVTIVFLAGTIIFFGSLRKVVITGTSMEPTLREGSACFVDLLYYRFHPIRRGDVVMVIHDGMELVKRVYAIEGDRIRFLVDPAAGMVHVLNNEFAKRLANMYGYREEKIPPGHVFILGDNPAVSEDSRMYGPIPRKEVIGIIRRMDLSFSHRFELPRGIEPLNP